MNRVGLIGARGHTGAELIRLIHAHPELELALASSRELAGQPVGEGSALHFDAFTPAQVAEHALDAVILALPNGASSPFVEALAKQPPKVIVDLSADHRFDPSWRYGLPELNRARTRGSALIANPGCYATAMQLSIEPLRDVLSGAPVCFGVSGYSGAGTTPSPKNDPEKLKDNLMPYGLTGHTHEAEVSAQLGLRVYFHPHVAPHFRGLTVTTHLPLATQLDLDSVRARFAARFADEPLIRLVDDPPWVSQIANCHHVELGGFALSPEGDRLVVVAVLDNLLKGAATQAIQNLNLALGLPELAGLTQSPSWRR